MSALFDEALTLCEIGYAPDFVFEHLFLEYELDPWAGIKGRSQKLPHFFPVTIWRESGIGYYVKIRKGGYASPPHHREYLYGGFTKSQMREFLSELEARHTEIPSHEAMLDAVAGTGVGLVLDVNASKLAKIWRSKRFLIKGRRPVAA